MPSTMRLLGERVRDEVLMLEGISQVDLKYARLYEIAIEVSEKELRRHGLTFDQVADVEYSDNDGATWTANPTSGQGGAPAGYDATITNWRINMQGNMATSGTFTLRYRVRVE